MITVDSFWGRVDPTIIPILDSYGSRLRCIEHSGKLAYGQVVTPCLKGDACSYPECDCLS